ncbi:type I 3-dehydroquinase-domain-containing protein [Talaromyces proteolyticus]|uniref:Type I 3-dehydroquinase-domain-containing protein n=1 Tax=Talaromyces proteolyticus TaxID=1131652 RepID=A0AAD4L1G7_9EURO|nr:type I 3-dehydroquinase-domain-containing protein [Talaromyces proteolyticus]KAH8703785.1 type I 3-dehydroquinase-domain-containing protein [Talaromyces proteolyticus]
MSILVRPPKRRLDDIEALTDQNHRRFSRGFSQGSGNSLGINGYSEADYGLLEDRLEVSRDGSRFAPRFRDLTSPSRFEESLQTQRKFSQNASIVLIGIRGTGKSSLAVMLAATYGRRLIEADRYFQQVTGRSRAAYKKEYTPPQYRRQEAIVMESMLMDHQHDCVIVCGSGDVERNGQILLREYAKTHPVIHILRDLGSIKSYLRTWDTEKVRRLLKLSGPIYRACSNFEFFNVSEKGIGDQTLGKDSQHYTQWDAEVDQRAQTSAPFLMLKRLQRDFLRFVAFATGNISELRNQLSPFPLHMQPIESRKFTYAATVPISSLLERDLDIEELESTADAFELKIDVSATPSAQLGTESNLMDGISQIVATVRRNIIVPLIYHVDRRVVSANQHTEPSRRSGASYLELVQQGLRLGPEFVTVDLSFEDSLLSQIIASKGSTKVIGHYSADQSLPKGWDDPEYFSIYERAKRLGCDMVRLTQPAASIDDNFAVERFRHQVKTLPGSQLPVIAYNSGPLGRKSCCFNPILTPVISRPLTSEAVTKELPSITIKEAQDALYSSFVLDPMQFFVFGANTTYSLSPAMHNAAFEMRGMPHTYRIHQSATLRGLNELVENPNFGGSSVSLPYKTEVIPLLHSMSPHARAIGAVNTLIPIRDLETSTDNSLDMEKSRSGPIKGLHGDNTDWIGICNCIRRGLSPANAIRPSTTGLVIGAGGMARAAIYSMIHLGVQNIFIWNRTFVNSEKLAQHYMRLNLHTLGRSGPSSNYHIHVLESLQNSWPANYKQPTIICSGIPAHRIGDQPAPNFRLPSQWIESPTGGVVVDLAYKPLNTPLMRQIRSLSHRGWVALDGLDVLPEQGFAQFELFTGCRAPRRLMRTIVLQEYKEEEQDADYDLQTRLENLDGQPM